MVREYSRIIVGGIYALLLGGMALASPLTPTSPEWVNQVWQLDDGLPNGTITGIAQTEDGYLWLGTHRGLVRFDGVRFQRIPLPGPWEMRFGLIRGVSTIHKDELWITMAGRVAVRFKGTETNVFTRYDGLSESRSLVSPTPAVEGKNGSAWIGFFDGFAYQIANGKISCCSTNEGLTGVGYCRLATDINGQLWFANSGNVGIYRDGRFVPSLVLDRNPVWIGPTHQGGILICDGAQLLRFNGTGEPKHLGRLPTDSAYVEPTALLEDRQGAIWIGTAADGLFRYDGTNAIVRIQTSHNYILSLAEDREGSIWVGTAGGGLNQVRRRVLELEGNSTRLAHEPVRSMCQDRSGALWVVGEDGWLSRQQPDGWHVFGTNDGWNEDLALCLASDPQGSVWVGTAFAGLYRWQDGVFTHLGTNEGIATSAVGSLLVDSKGNLWVGSGTAAIVQRWRQGELTTFVHPKDEFPITTIAEDAAGIIWMASAEGRLLRVSGDAIVDDTERALSPPIYILSLHTTPDGSLWIGYAGAGLGRLRNGTFATIDTQQGLLDNYLSGIANDDYGNLWFACDHGIFKVRQRELDDAAEGRVKEVLAVAYGRDQSLPNLQANHSYSPASIHTREGKILFPMDSGFSIVHPERAHSIAYIPPVLIESMAVDGREVNIHRIAREPSLPPAHFKLELEFTALSFASPENVRLRYRLTGWDKDWLETRQQRKASYTRLPAGQYTFEVAARNNLGVWSTPAAALRFRVRPFFWQTWEFRILSVLLLAALVAALVRQHERRKHRAELERLERRAAIERERTRMAEDLHDDLGAGLTEIGLAASLAQRQNASPERIQEHLHQVTDKANAMVLALDEIVWAINPRHDSVVSLSHYLCEYAQHFLKLSALRCRLEVADNLPDWPLNAEQRHNLFLAFKESLTNVARHAQATEVRIRVLTQAEGTSIIEVEDNGRGINQPPGMSAGSDGLANMVRRIQQIGGCCEIEGIPSGGTRVRFVLPCAETAGNKPSI